MAVDVHCRWVAHWRRERNRIEYRRECCEQFKERREPAFQRLVRQWSQRSVRIFPAISTVPVSDQQYELTNAASLPSSPITVTAAMTLTGVYSLNVYTIHYLRPIDESTAASYVINTGKNGRVIPVKVEIFKNTVPYCRVMF